MHFRFFSILILYFCGITLIFQMYEKFVILALQFFLTLKWKLVE